MTNETLTLSSYHHGDRIYEGKSCNVFKGRLKNHLTFVAIKKFSNKLKDRVVRETTALTMIPPHPHIIKHLSFHETHNHNWIVNEYCAGGSLDNVITTDSDEFPISRDVLAKWAVELLSALSHLHSHQYVYSNLTPDNIIFDVDSSLILSDFGNAHLISSPFTSLSKIPKYSSYVAPEVIAGQEPSFSSDLWSLGVLLFHGAIGHSNFLEIPSISESNHVIRSKIVNHSDDFSDFVVNLLQSDPNRRLSWSGVLSHPFLCKLTHNISSPHVIESNATCHSDDVADDVTNKFLIDIQKLLKLPIDFVATSLITTTVHPGDIPLDPHFPPDFKQRNDLLLNWIESLAKSFESSDFKEKIRICRLISRHTKESEVVASEIARSRIFSVLIDFLLTCKNLGLIIRSMETMAVIVRFSPQLSFLPESLSKLIDHVIYLISFSCPNCNGDASPVSNDLLLQRRLGVALLGELAYYLVYSRTENLGEIFDQNAKLWIKNILSNLIALLLKYVDTSDCTQDSFRLKKNTCHQCLDDQSVLLTIRSIGNVINLIGDLYLIVDNPLLISSLCFIASNSPQALHKSASLVTLSRILVFFPSCFLKIRCLLPPLVSLSLKNLHSTTPVSSLLSIYVYSLLNFNHKDQELAIIRTKERVVNCILQFSQGDDVWTRGKCLLIMSLLILPTLKEQINQSEVIDFDLRCLLFLANRGLFEILDKNLVLEPGKEIPDVSVFAVDNHLESEKFYLKFSSVLLFSVVKAAVSSSLDGFMSSFSLILTSSRHPPLSDFLSLVNTASVVEKSLSTSDSIKKSIITSSFLDRLSTMIPFLIFSNQIVYSDVEEQEKYSNAILAIKKSLLKSCELISSCLFIIESFPVSIISFVLKSFIGVLINSCKISDEFLNKNVAPLLLKCTTEMVFYLFKKDLKKNLNNSGENFSQRKDILIAFLDLMVPSCQELFPALFDNTSCVGSAIKFCGLLSQISTEFCKIFVNNEVISRCLVFLSIKSNNCTLHNFRFISSILGYLPQNRFTLFQECSVGLSLVAVVGFVASNLNNPQIHAFSSVVCSILQTLLVFFEKYSDNSNLIQLFKELDDDLFFSSLPFFCDDDDLLENCNRVVTSLR
ncbi:hypothetical protein RCL1_007788 [Eukaryota sp. TZLM3-RCL]